MYVNRRIAGIATIVIAMLAVLAVLSTPAMAVCYCPVSQDCPGSKNGTVSGEVFLTNISDPTAGNYYWEFEVPSGTVQWAQIHWYSWGADFPATATFCNETACQDMTFEYNATCEQNETCGYWASDMGSHHFFWTVNASSGTNNLTLDGDCFDARWKFFVAVINGTTTTKHNGRYWVNNGFSKNYTLTTWFNDSANNINTSANHTLTTFISHYDNVSMYFNETFVNYYGQYDCGMMYSNGLTKDTINNASINATHNNMTWTDTTTCTGGDDFFPYIAVLAEEGTTTPRPDLVVTGIDIGTPRPDTNFKVYATVKNQGTANAEGFNVSLYVNGSSSPYDTNTSISGLNADTSTTVSFSNVNLSKGCHKFRVFADSDNNITDESNENNNNMTKDRQVGYVIVVESYSDFDDLVTESDDGLLGAGNVSHSGNTYYIQNFTGNSAIENCNGDGVIIKNLNTTTKFVINNCTIRNCTGNGVKLHNLTNGTINGSVIQNNSYYGIKIGVVPLGSDDPKFVNITNNIINDTKTYNGINLIGFNCTVKDNNVTNNSVYGIYVLGNDSNIMNNNITDNDDYGVKLYNSAGNYVYCNNFTDNNVTGHQAWDNKATNYWNTTDAGKNYTGNYWKDWQNNNGFPCNYTIDGGDAVDKRPKGLYDFLTGKGTDKWAFRYQVDDKPPDLTDNTVPDTVFTTAQHTNISVDDQTFQNDTAADRGKYAAHRFNFSISEDPNDISKINVTWNGIGTRFNNDGATLYIWDFVSTPAAYVELDTDTSSAEVYLTGEKTALVDTISDYIDSSGNMTILVVQNKDSGNPEAQKSAIKTDYVRVAITL